MGPYPGEEGNDSPQVMSNGTLLFNEWRRKCQGQNQLPAPIRASALSILSITRSFPRVTITSSIPGLMVFPVRATRSAWAIHLSQMDSMETFTLEGSTYSLYVPLKDPFALELRRAGEVLVSVNLISIVELAKKQSEGKPEEMFVLVENERVNLRLLVRSLRGSTRSGETEIEELNGLLLLTLK